MRTPWRGAAAATILVLATATGCAEWPRYLYVDGGVDGIQDRRVAFEDEALDGDTDQFVGEIDPLTELSLYGYLTHCGYDSAAEWPEWPLHDFDEDGDGVVDSQKPFHDGWYAGDVDWFAFDLTEDSEIDGELSWDRRPSGDANAPYEPDDDNGDWRTESDLDVVVFRVEGPSRTLINESGISNAYPEALASASRVNGGIRVAVAVACHHELPTDYGLVLTIR